MVPECVVHLLEAVEVDEEQRDAVVRPVAGSEQLAEPAAEQHPVGQPGQGVMCREVLQ